MATIPKTLTYLSAEIVNDAVLGRPWNALTKDHMQPITRLDAFFSSRIAHLAIPLDCKKTLKAVLEIQSKTHKDSYRDMCEGHAWMINKARGALLTYDQGCSRRCRRCRRCRD